jgi:GlpG protein
MRVIGEFSDRSNAELFSDYLTQLHIDNQIMEESGDSQVVFEIWVHDEDNVSRAEELLSRFRENPDSQEYQDVSRKAKKIRREALKEEKDGPKYMDARTTVFYKGGTPQMGKLTVVLIVISVAVAIFSKLGAETETLMPLFITDFVYGNGGINWFAGLPEIMSGEVWRLFTPMFIHFGFIHLIFNMMWLYDLGNMVEDRKGILFFALFIITVSCSSNLLQYAFSHPVFGGMSGVNYGLFGYIWMKGKYDPTSQLSLHNSTVVLMISWFVLCWTGVLGSVANWAHTGGLVVGVVWGFLTSTSFRHQIKKFRMKK